MLTSGVDFGGVVRVRKGPPEESYERLTHGHKRLSPEVIPIVSQRHYKDKVYFGLKEVKRIVFPVQVWVTSALPVDDSFQTENRQVTVMTLQGRTGRGGGNHYDC